MIFLIKKRKFLKEMKNLENFPSIALKKNTQNLEEINDCANSFYFSCDCDHDYDNNDDYNEDLEALGYYG